MDVNRQEVVTDSNTFHLAMLEKFTAYWDRAKNNIGIYGIDHWNDVQKKKFKIANRVALNIPILTQKVNALLGFERENRTEAEYVGVGAEDELNGEILTRLRKWTENTCTPKYNYIKSDIFRDGIVACYGALEIYEEKDIVGKTVIKMRRLPYNSVLWDLNFYDYEMLTCPRMQKVRWVYTDELKRDYPDKEEEIDKEIETIGNQDSSMYHHLKDFDQFYQVHTLLNDEKRYLCKEITDYNKKNYVCYDVIKLNLKIPTEIAEDKISFFTRKEAQEKINELTEKLKEFGISGKESFKIKTTVRVRVQKTVTTGNTVLVDPEWTDDDEFPIKILFSYFFDGQFWTPVDVGRDTQNYFDKTFAQIDKSIGEGVKHGKIIYPTALHPSMSVTDADRRLTDGRTIYGLDPKLKPFEVITAPAFNQQYTEVLQITQSILEDAYGGRNFQGLTENAGQSGVAISNLQQAGATLTLNFLENLQRFDENVARFLMKKMIKAYDYKMKIRILGSDFTNKVMDTLKADPELYTDSASQEGVGFLTVNGENQKPIYESNYDIEVKPISSRRNEKDIKFQKLMQYAQITGNPLPPDLVGKMLELSPTEITELTQYAKALEEKQIAQAQFDAKMKIAEATKPDSRDLQTLENINNSQTAGQEQKVPPMVVTNNQTQK
jgi:hypothetical protein